MTVTLRGSADPEHISISKSRGIKIDWQDGHHSEYALQYLRDQCPCATCTGAHGGVPLSAQPAAAFQMYKPAIKMNSVEPVGNYAVRILWNDGHSTGIYSYEHLRKICPCEVCAGQRTEGRRG